MHTKVVARMVVLAGLMLASSPALAATAKGAPRSSADRARPRSTKHMHHRKAILGATHAPQRGHHAEPAKTPEVEASIAEPMVFRTDAPPKAHHGRQLMLRRVSTGDKPPPASKPETKPETKADTKADSKLDSKLDAPGDKHLLTRSHAAPPGASAPKSKAPCLQGVVELAHDEETERFPLTQCDGTLAPLAIEKLSVLVRPENAQRPTAPLESLAKAKGVLLSPGVRKIDGGLVTRLEELARHFGKNGTPRISVVSGYRPNSEGSYHATGQALDLRIDGVSNEALIAFCKTLTDTGCGYYPNSSFVHVDVRPPSTGHVYWIDTSGPGEPAHYVSSWPPPAEQPLKDSREASRAVVGKLDRELPPLPVDEHPAEADDVPASMDEPIKE
jgi:uncharacterized protein DUF882